MIKPLINYRIELSGLEAAPLVRQMDQNPSGLSDHQKPLINHWADLTALGAAHLASQMQQKPKREALKNR